MNANTQGGPDDEATRQAADAANRYVLKAETGRYVSAGASAKFGVTRGNESWTYIYVMMGFALTIEGNLVAMTPLTFPWNISVYAGAAWATFWLFTDSGWFQNKLLWLRTRYENKSR